jgi:hypothetical protein
LAGHEELVRAVVRVPPVQLRLMRELVEDTAHHFDLDFVR